MRRYSKNKSELEGLVTGVAGVSIRSVAVDPRGKSVAVTSEYASTHLNKFIKLIRDNSELTVKVVDLDDTLKIKILKGHTRGVRKVTWHPSGSLLVCDLCFKVGWYIEDNLLRLPRAQTGRSLFGTFLKMNQEKRKSSKV